jgi:hypothetical protein
MKYTHNTTGALPRKIGCEVQICGNRYPLLELSLFWIIVVITPSAYKVSNLNALFMAGRAATFSSCTPHSTSPAVVLNSLKD